MRKLIFTKGISGSGKSTWAKDQVDNSDGNTVIVCKDDLRNMLHNGAYSKGRENLVKKMRNAMILLALEEGKNVIVADTNFDNHIQNITDCVREFYDASEVAIEVKDFTDVPLEVCIERDAKRSNSLGEKVIRDQYNRWIRKEFNPKMIERDPNKKDCVCFDIDGTITTGPKNRSPYEWQKVGQDEVNEPVKEMTRLFHVDNQIVIVSGRDGSCRNETEKWLADNNIIYDYLYMREANDNRPDDIVKEEIIDNMILTQFNIKLWVDDRLKVCRMVYRKGIPLLRVGDPDADF